MPTHTRRLTILLLLLAGAALRLYYVQAHSSFMQSDEALVGLQAKHILTDGHRPIFDYAEERGGTLFMYLVAPFFALFGVSNLVFKTVAIALSLLLIYLLYLLARRAGGHRVGLIALALLALAPPFFIMWSLHGAAQYVVMMVCGAASLLLCDNLLFERGLNRPPQSRRRRLLTFGLLGFVLGIGLWESPLVISFLAAIWIVLFLHDRRCFFRTSFLVFLVGFVVANIPAILFNALPEVRAAGGLPGSPNWVSYTSLFFSPGGSLGESLRELPTTLGQMAQVSLPAVLGGTMWPFDTAFPRRAIAVLMVSFWSVAILHTVWQRLRFWWGDSGARHWSLTAIDAPLLTFVLTFLVFVLSHYRYLVREPRYLLPWFAFLPIAGALFIDWLLARRKYLAFSLLIAVLAGNLLTTVYFSPGLDPDHGLWPEDEALMDYLVEQEIRHPIADFWIAYSMAFEADERVIPVPIGYFRFGFYPQLLAQPLATHYVFPKRQTDDRYFDFFRYGLVGRQWSARQFEDFMQRMGVPPDAYQALEFEHYVLYDVPREFLDPALVASTTEEIVVDPLTPASRYLEDTAGAGDAVLLALPDPAGALLPLESRGIRLYHVPDDIPRQKEAAGRQLQEILAQRRPIFLVTGDPGLDGDRVLETWLARYAYPIEQRWIGQVRVMSYAAAMPTAEQPTQFLAVRFGEQIELTGIDLPQRQAAPGEALPVSLFWQAQRPTDENLKVFLHLVDGAGRLVAQRDTEPQAGLRPTSGWVPGETVEDRHGLLLPADLPSGEYTLLAGLYDPASGERLRIDGGSGGNEQDALTLGTIAVGQ